MLCVKRSYLFSVRTGASFYEAAFDQEELAWAVSVTRPAAQTSAKRTTPRAEQDASFLRGLFRFKCVYAR